MNLYQLAKDDGVDRFFKQTSWLTILEPVADMFVDIRWYYEIYVPKRWWRDTDRFFKQTSWAEPSPTHSINTSRGLQQQISEKINGKSKQNRQ